MKSSFPNSLQDRLLGGLYGLLIGDACGVPYEFKKPHLLPNFDQIDMIPPGEFKRSWLHVPVGTYSDDGAQALCLLEVLANIKNINDFCPNDLLPTLLSWWRTGHMSVDSDTFDIGNQTAAALTSFQYGKSSEALNVHTCNGNGSLMRSLPVTLALIQFSVEDVIRVAGIQSQATHPHIRSVLCCKIYTAIAYNLLHHEADKNEAVDAALTQVRDTLTLFDELREFDLVVNGQHSELQGTGYVVDSLWSAIGAFVSGDSYRDVVKKAISFGNDTDTTACIAGGLAGIYYGYKKIPLDWLTLLRGQEIIKPLVVDLWRHV